MIDINMFLELYTTLQKTLIMLYTCLRNTTKMNIDVTLKHLIGAIKNDAHI